MSASSSQKTRVFFRNPRTPGGANEKQGKIRIGPAYLNAVEKALINPDLGNILGKVDGRLNISTGPNGGADITIQARNGKTIAQKADVMRIMSLNMSINAERKAAQQAEVSYDLKVVLAGIVKTLEEQGKLPSKFKFPENFVDTIRGVITLVRTVNNNVRALEGIAPTNATARDIRDAFLEYGKRIRIAVGAYMLHRALLSVSETPKRLNDFFYDEKVPAYIYGKLSVAKIDTKSDGFDIRSILFPSDPSKGFYLTFREARNSEFRNAQLGLLAGAAFIFALVDDSSLIKRLINVSSDTNITDFDTKDSLASKLANTPFLIPPFGRVIEPDVLFGFLAKNGVRGIAWSAGSVSTPQDNLKFVGTVAKRAAYFALYRPQHNTQVFETLFPGFQYDASSEKKDVYVQLKDWAAGNESDLTYLDYVVDAEAVAHDTENYSKVLANVFGLPKDNPLFVSIERAAGIMNLHVPDEAKLLSDSDDAYSAIRIAGSALTANKLVEKTLEGRFSGKLPGEGKKKDKKSSKKAGTFEFTTLGGNANKCLAIAKSFNESLADRLSEWFKLFSDDEVQDAVANLLSTRLKGYLEAPMEQSVEDRVGFLDPVPGVFDDEDAESSSDEEEVELGGRNGDDALD